MRRPPADSVLRGTKDLRELPIVRVRWVDAAANTSWGTLEQKRKLDGIKCSTVGYLTKNTREIVQVVATINDEGDLSDTVTIPRAWQTGRVEVLRLGRARRKVAR